MPMQIQQVSNPITANNSIGTATATTYSATSTAGTALAANANRRRVSILNPASNTATVFIGFAAAVTAATGIPLAPGQIFVDESPCHTGLISAITASGTAAIAVTEWV